MRLSGEEVDVQNLVVFDLVSRIWVGVQASPRFRVQETSPHQEGVLISSSIHIRQYTIDYVGHGRDEVYGVHGRVHVSSVLDALDV